MGGNARKRKRGVGCTEIKRGDGESGRQDKRGRKSEEGKGVQGRGKEGRGAEDKRRREGRKRKRQREEERIMDRKGGKEGHRRRKK